MATPFCNLMDRPQCSRRYCRYRFNMARATLPAAPFSDAVSLTADNNCSRRRATLDRRTLQIAAASPQLAGTLVGQQVIDLLHEPVEINGLGVELVAAGRQRLLAGAGHGMCGERDD